MNVLIADDNRNMREILKSVLAGVFATVYEAADGAEAIITYEKHQPEWVLMDLRMKPVDGLAATRAIVGQFPRARIAIVTSSDDAESREAALNAGARDYFLKDNLGLLRKFIAEESPAPTRP